MKKYLMERRRKILSRVQESGIQYVLASSPENIFYFTGFWGGGYALLSNEQCTLFTGALENHRAKDRVFETRVLSPPFGTSLISMLSEYVAKGSKILIEDIPYTQKAIIEEKTGAHLNVSSKPFYELRSIKDRYEIRMIEEASTRIDRLFEYTLKVLKEGTSERELASKIVGEAILIGLEMPMVSSGFEPLIIASGPNSSLPHASLTDRRIRRGDTVKGDYFFRYEGYVSDETRTFVLGRATRQIKEVYETVRFSQEEGLKTVKAGAITGEVDSICRKIIEDKGYKDYYTHGTGHGVGLEVHEPPTLSSNQKERLEKGNVVTVEPGIYLPKKFGIRIEDTVLVGRRAKTLTTFPKELIEV
ncbi:MAG: M24 family metallopeptidase [Nitrososphaeria archaeon]